MRNKQHAEHDAISFSLNAPYWEKRENGEPIQIISAFVENPKMLITHFRKWLQRMLANPEHCPICGAIIHELVIQYEGKEYWFTLWKIKDINKDKAIIETDYKKFARYCKAIASKR